MNKMLFEGALMIIWSKEVTALRDSILKKPIDARLAQILNKKIVF